jgi:SET domain-containing protein
VPVPDRKLATDEEIFLMQHTRSHCIDARDDKGIGRKINHSRTKANCCTKTEQVGSRWRVFIYAMEDIRRGAEVLYDYKLVDCSHPWANQ